MKSWRYALSRRATLVTGLSLTAAWLVIYVLTTSPTVNFIDSGELITALHEPGVVHPPGYPLYTLLGYVASLLPLGEVAHRVNLFSAFCGAVAVGTMYCLLVTSASYISWLRARRVVPSLQRRKASKAQPRSPEPETIHQAYDLTIVLSALAAACLLGAASTFWNRSIQAKMYTFHYFFVLLLFWLAVSYRWSYERNDRPVANRYALLLAVSLGLSFTNHLMTSLLVPGLAILLLAGRNWRARLQVLAKRLTVLVPAFLLPLLLYLYLPIRSSQGPIMDWGSPNTLGGFWRHISGWQYTAYVNNTGDELAKSRDRLVGYASQQWSWLTIVVFALAIAAAILLARTNVPLLLATLTTAIVTFGFALKYGISEIEPYLVPLYEMLIIWLGLAPSLLDSIITGVRNERAPGESAPSSTYGLPAAALLSVLAVVGIALQFPRQNHSNDHLAEMFAKNILDSLEPNSIIITDHWDFQSPSYYLQLVQNVRPDVAIVDKSLLRYPWYLGQLERRHPWLIGNSQDIAQTFRAEDRKWVNGEPFDGNLLQQSYIGLLTSFVERNVDQHPAYVFFSSQCDPSMGQGDSEDNQIAATYTRQLAGLAYRLWPKPPPANTPPPDPSFDLRGYTYDKTPLDEFARANARCYANAFSLAAQAQAGAGNAQKAQDLANKATELQRIASGQ